MWLQAAGDAAAAKHRDSLFRYLYKGTLRVAAEAAGAAVARGLASLALKSCLASPSKDRFVQVAAKLGGSLPGGEGVPMLWDALDSLPISPQAGPQVLALLDAVSKVLPP
eukprot:CAMPEP_0182891040 /NCGR_PEP_ID=MMETSP0034_2-20130328/23013_1 /TAXON_ID=156128 /ORGANISM="Nephroselmis pyriformis, Strain CCMP717" /LENGTH=109 /DNA_ID=CAMNT_0025024629 /DNA_START=74 /DNA_END=400 /DNA_ORIENTATION=-